MMVSIIEMGAGSSGLSTRPSLPTTRSTSGMALIAMSWSWRTSRASPIEACGIVVGIQRNEPSSRSGMNSLPRPGKVWLMATQGFERRTAWRSPPRLSDRPGNDAEHAIEPQPGRGRPAERSRSASARNSSL